MSGVRLLKYIQTDATAFTLSREINSIGYFVDTGSSTNAKRQLVFNLANALNLPHDSIKADLNIYAISEQGEDEESE